MLFWIATWLVMPILRQRVQRVVGLEQVPRRGPFILAANHTSWIDPALVASLVYPVVRQKIYFLAASRKYRALGGLPIDQRNKGWVIEEALAKLRQNNVVGIFPQGDTEPNRPLNQGRTGVARLALWSGAPVIPVGVKNTSGTNPITGSVKVLRIPDIEVRFGHPVSFESVSREATTYELLVATTAEITRRIAELLNK